MERRGDVSGVAPANEALFVLSTGRCGTQWLADTLRRILGYRAVVAHEPLDNDYQPRAMLGVRDVSQLDPELAAPIHELVAGIEAALRERPYVECGHPSWSTLPYLLDRFAGRVRVIHLVRHPVPTAWSWVTMGAYCAPMAPHLQQKVLLSPFDEGIRFPTYRERWASLNPYEKTLFYWAEVTAFALELEQRTGAPWLRVRFEDLFEDCTLRRILDFAGWGALDASHADQRTVDEYHAVTPFWCDSALVSRQPEVLATANALAYDPMAIDESKLRRRYFRSPAVRG
jgi:hypothetical protein